MKLADIPFNTNTSFSEDLREIPEDFEQFREGIEWLKNKIEESELESLDRGVMLSLCGGLSRIVMDLDQALEQLKEALRIFQTHSKIVPEFVCQIRLAHTYQYKEDFVAAEEIFLKLLQELKANPKHPCSDHLDFVFQHYGKCLLEMNYLEKAETLFLKALEIRLAKGDLELIESTQKALHCLSLKKS